MPLMDDIKLAAKDLGKQLGADSEVRAYVRLEEQAKQDAEVTALELRYSQLYQSLVTRQQNGENLDRSELDEYYHLKGVIQDHPLVEARDRQLVQVKALFAQTAQRLTDALGIEYPTFAG